MSTGLYTLVANGTATATVTRPGGHSVTVPISVTTPSGGAPDIVAGDTVIINSDSAFAAATQLSDLVQESGQPSTGQFFPYGSHTDGVGYWEGNLDGSGKHAIRLQYPAMKKTTITTGFSLSGSAQTITVGSTAGVVSGGNWLMLDALNANGNYEEVASSNWSVVDGTHLSVIATKNHSAGEQVSYTYEDGSFLEKDFTPPTLGAYYRMRSHSGKTATSSGIGVVPAFPGDNSAETYFAQGDKRYSGCKRFLLERTGRIYFIYVPDGLGASTGHIEMCSDGINLSRTINVAGATFNPDSLWGKDVEWVVFFRPGTSGDGSTGTGQSTDGVVRLWINGVKLMDYTNLPIGTGGVTGLQFPATMRSALYDMSEYYTHVSAWIPAVQP